MAMPADDAWFSPDSAVPSRTAFWLAISRRGHYGRGVWRRGLLSIAPCIFAAAQTVGPAPARDSPRILIRPRRTRRCSSLARSGRLPARCLGREAGREVVRPGGGANQPRGGRADRLSRREINLRPPLTRAVQRRRQLFRDRGRFHVGRLREGGGGMLNEEACIPLW